jgi:hypothetical protein
MISYLFQVKTNIFQMYLNVFPVLSDSLETSCITAPLSVRPSRSSVPSAKFIEAGEGEERRSALTV